MLLLKKLDAIRQEMWVEVKPYIVHIIALLIVLYIIHQAIVYWIHRKATKKGVIEGLQTYERGKKNS